jgi:hypothetical protein
MSLIYGRQLENRTDYLKDYLGRDFGKPALEASMGFTAIEIRYAAAAT